MTLEERSLPNTEWLRRQFPDQIAAIIPNVVDGFRQSGADAMRGRCLALLREAWRGQWTWETLIARVESLR